MHIIDSHLVISFDLLNAFDFVHQFLLFLLDPHFLFRNACRHDSVLLLTTFDIYFGSSIFNHFLLQHLAIHQFTWLVSTNDFSHRVYRYVRRWLDLSDERIVSSAIAVQFHDMFWRLFTFQIWLHSFPKWILWMHWIQSYFSLVLLPIFLSHLFI